jgi:nucleotide-binding universal stress UspA family protein
MSRRVLIPLDRTDRAEAALGFLPAICEPGDELILLSIAEPGQPLQRGMRPGRIVRADVGGPIGGVSAASRPDFPVYAETRDQTIQRQIDEMMDYLRPLASKLEGQGYKVTTACEISPEPSEAIAEVARQVKPSFIMMQRTTHPGFGERLFGTVAQHVIREDIAPMLILPSASPA